MDLNLLLKQVIDLAVQASSFMKDVEFDVSEKGGAVNIVTTADVNVQRFLCQNLVKILPDSGFICEEEDFKDVQHEYVWVIDPIDGTANFSRGIPECAICIALVKDKQAIMGVVYNPYHDETFYAIKGQGAFLNGKKITTSNATFDKGLLCTAMSLYNKDFAQDCIEVISDAYLKCNDVRRFGACAIELCYIAMGKCDLFFEIRVFPWDYAAASVILQEAGGVLTGLDGKTLSFDTPSLLIGANNKENHKKLFDIVSSHIKSLPY